MTFSDFRSDTVTRPTGAMRRAMAEAEVGDDVYGEDPTVRRLEDRTAELLGREAALFVPTGSMGNQISLRVLARPGSEVIVESRAHVFNAEMAAMSALSGLLPRPIATADGILTPADVEPWIQTDHPLRPRTALLALENTINFWGGRIVPLDAQKGLAALCRRRGIALHLDGSRIWNAAAATGIPERELAAGADSVNVCFSKGLGAPVGSAVAGTHGFVEEARRARKLFGGGMRQAGILAAAALVALDSRDRLVEDHALARRLAEGLSGLPGISLPYGCATNIVIFVASGRKHAADWVAGFRGEGVLCGAYPGEEVRMVTHRDVTAADVDRALTAARRIAES
ncbi:MAG TPA: GntG family PLP-dependent aldolase [Thermoanaerobaculia bacterium]|nr:GntG family PLP-dependent aldolase [Thermoanaerobaculia bacterium]